MALEIIIGKNKTGKTDYLKNRYKNDKDPKVLFIDAEIDFDAILKGNTGTARKEIPSPHKKIIDFLNNIVGKSFLIQLDQSDYQKLVEHKKNFDAFSEKIKKYDDYFFEDCFKNSLNTTKLENNSFPFNLNLIEFHKIDKNGSSGSLNYSLIKILYELIMDENIFISDEFTLVIDEVEKFLHPELIFKIANMIVKISEKINVVITTHSPLFLERIFYAHKKNIKVQNESNIKYFIKYEYGNDKIKMLDKEAIDKILKDRNYRELMNLSNFLFSSKCFLIEGLIDHTIINDIASEGDKSFNIYTIIDCHSKNSIKVMFKNIKSLGILPYYKICLFYDKDCVGKDGETFEIADNEKEYVISIVNDPNIEETFFQFNKESKSIITKTKNIQVSKFKKEEGFVFTKDWIIKNSTKEDVKDKLKKLEKKILDFLNK